MLTDASLLDLILPTLRADYAVCESFVPWADGLLDCPVSVFGGTEDKVSTDQLQAWSGTTQAAASWRTFPGGHFFLTGESAPAVLGAVSEALAAPAEAPYRGYGASGRSPEPGPVAGRRPGRATPAQATGPGRISGRAGRRRRPARARAAGARSGCPASGSRPGPSRRASPARRGRPPRPRPGSSPAARSSAGPWSRPGPARWCPSASAGRGTGASAPPRPG
ncbi:hypothetical protein GXW82_17530 [Streptacidiphilus sp. 4-A2]|nr:hypothetical protein [Streptacidiphilus sp. 4-A2]